MPEKVRALIIEDSDDDAVLITSELQRGGYDPEYKRVETALELERALANGEFDVVISDYSLPQFNGLAALQVVQNTGRDIPFILVSGSVPESTIVEAMRAGARDYVMKTNLTRLPLAVRRELEEAAERRRRRDFDEQLRHTQRLESLGVLAGGVAHDFNNLLTGVLGNASLALEMAPEKSNLTPMLERIVDAAEQAANLTRQLLAYAGKGRFLIEPLDLSAVVREARPLLHASVLRNIRLLFELNGALPQVEGDRGQIQQLLMNLVINGAEAIGPDRHGTVLVRTGIHNLTEEEIRSSVIPEGVPPCEYVCLEVQDSGSGMDPETQGHIFDPFFTTKFTGRGLGLSAVLGIVRSHKGTITFATGPGRGTTFTVYLPMSGSREPGVRPGELRGMVLVVDDDDTVRRTAKAALEQHGLNVLEAESGQAGVELFRAYADRISLVLLDLTMPDLNGYEVLEEIHRVRPDVPVLITSGFSEGEAMERFRGDGVAGFVQKPYTVERLISKVASTLVEENAS